MAYCWCTCPLSLLVGRMPALNRDLQMTQQRWQHHLQRAAYRHGLQQAVHRHDLQQAVHWHCGLQQAIHRHWFPSEFVLHFLNSRIRRQLLIRSHVATGSFFSSFCSALFSIGELVLVIFNFKETSADSRVGRQASL